MSKLELSAEERETLHNIPEGQVAFRATLEQGVFEVALFRKENPNGTPAFRLDKNERTGDFFGPNGEVVFHFTGDDMSGLNPETAGEAIVAAWGIPGFDKLLLTVVNEALLRMLVEEMTAAFKEELLESIRGGMNAAKSADGDVPPTKGTMH